jgi:hypothetical protein
VKQFLVPSRCVAVLTLSIFLTTLVHAASKERVIYDLQPANQYASGGLVSDEAGNLYGAADGTNGYGSIYKLSPPVEEGGKWTETTIYTFNGTDGAQPEATLILDKQGNLYGTTFDGGTGTCTFTIPGCGVVFELSPAPHSEKWTETILYDFKGGKDGSHPQSPLVFDARGNLYGSTDFGGDLSCANEQNKLGCGVIFRLSPSRLATAPWSESVLHAFHGGRDGALPEGPLFLTGDALYGSTYEGGGSSSCQEGCGVVFALDASGETVIHVFSGNDGAGAGGVIGNSAGDLFGVTGSGGQANWGTVYQLKHSSDGWTETLLYSFNGSNDGGNPNGLIIDQAGNLYGVAGAGGDASDCGWEPPFTGCGVTFKLATGPGDGWTETILHTFTNGTEQQDADGGIPRPGPTFGKMGLLYGATMIGGTGVCYTEQGIDTGCGTVYQLAP